MRGTLGKVLKKYKGQVKLVYRHLPIETIHDDAMGAAIASECAAEQGRFWPFHDGIFDSRAGMGKSALLAIARKVGVRNMSKFKACTNSSRYRSLVSEDMKAAAALGIRGTPGFFIGTLGDDGMLEGLTLSGAQPLASFVAIIEKIRAQQGK